MSARKDITGQRFGRLIAVKPSHSDRRGQLMWECLCDCGKTTVVRGADLRFGKTRSCLCLYHEVIVTHGGKNRTHGHSHRTLSNGSPEYQSWMGAKVRCLNPKHKIYPQYGGRGITMCARWRDSFEAFLADMGPRPAGTSLDRYPNNDGNYEPGNCRWATQREQCNNKRNNQRLQYDGLDLTTSEWARRVGIGKATIRDRIKRGWATARALTEPV